jgi:hypothetical protein
VVVLWIKNSVASDWVLSETGRAHADRKLIPLRAGNLSYRDVPPPFDNMHMEHIDDREKIVAAIIAQLAKPSETATRIAKALSKTKLELLSWFGIVGATTTLVTNLRGVLTIAEWARIFLEKWTAIAHAIWSNVLFFLPNLRSADAVSFTFLAFLTASFATSFRKRTVQKPSPIRVFLAWLTLLYAISIVVEIMFASWQSEPSLYLTRLYSSLPWAPIYAVLAKYTSVAWWGPSSAHTPR